ncbi:MAG TPA: alpha/beta hydrolase [Gemmatimonadales bacterium]
MKPAARFLSLALAAGGLSAGAALNGSGRTVPVRFAHVDLQSGVRLRYAEAGNSAGEPIIMLHGYSDSWYSFSPIMPLLGSRYRLLALDQRGHGASDQPATGYAMRDLVQDVLAFMDELEIPRATIIGHSMGSLVAQQVGLAAPERVTRLVLIGSGTALGAMNDRAGFEAAVQSLEDPVPLEFIRGFQESTIHHPVAPAFLDSVVVESTRLTARVWKALLEGMFAADKAEGLASAGIPTLLVWGEEDSVFPKSNRDALSSMLPHAERLDYEDTGHATHWERPDQFVEDVEEFIRRTPVAAAASR